MIFSAQKLQFVYHFQCKAQNDDCQGGTFKLLFKKNSHSQLKRLNIIKIVIIITLLGIYKSIKSIRFSNNGLYT